MLIQAGQPEILRAAQRDETFQRELYDALTELLQSILGIRTWMTYREYCRIFSNILYHSLTTLSNLQTLGEEYTGIFQVNSSGRSLQSKYLQLLMILLNSCGEEVLIHLLKWTENTIKYLSEQNLLQHEAWKQLIQVFVYLRSSLPFIQRLHKGIFYLNGNYYEFGKRFTGTKYVLVRYWLRDRSTITIFRFMGIISFLHLFLHLYVVGIKLKIGFMENIQDMGITKTNENEKCTLCLSRRKNTSSTSCGHLFCWTCILSWLQEQPHCPLCRKAVQPSRVVFLQNY